MRISDWSSDVCSSDLRIGGNALSPAARAAALAPSQLPPEAGDDGEEPIDFAANAAIKGTLPNSAAETWTAGAGAAWITDGGNLGISYSHYDSLYGVPVRYATEPGQEQEAPRLDVVQNRFDVRGEVDAGGGLFDRIQIGRAHAHYRHFELEEDNSVKVVHFRSEERRVGKECVSTCRSGRSPYH